MTAAFSPPWWAVALAVVLVLLFASHARLYYTGGGCGGASLLQASVDTVTSELLAERRPIVIEDRVVNPADLVATVFRWQYAWRSGVEPCRLDAFETCRARFTLLFFLEGDDSTVVIKAPTNTNTNTNTHTNTDTDTDTHTDTNTDIAVRLAAGRTLVLPPMWRYLPLSVGARRIRLHDPVSLLLQPSVRA
jgi:hypothetical protein